MTDTPSIGERPLPTPTFRHVARIVLGTVILTFVASRVVVILIMLKKMPDLFLHVGPTHVHHLNYGIFILSAVGAYLLFRRPESGRPLRWAAIAYSIGLGLTFDEFGMWVNLGGSYWQKASFDAVVVVAAAFGLIAYMPSPSRFRTEHWFWTLVITLTTIGFLIYLFLTASKWAQHYAPWFKQIEVTGPQ